ncbi:aldo/keto reductase [Kutzneria sp. NPDC052558]|uniref:aldo/keto reductase n=1 Tax=Kutzneria sp. NPDC052558 TaxID=3364121 RepID=UPI0037C687AF
MEFRRVGTSGLSVSELAYGNWLAGPDDAACVAAALDAGITTFRTAAAWAGGAAEESMAAALSGVPREDLVLCTGVYWAEGAGANRAGLSRKHLVSSINGSLRRLGTDYVDVYLLLRFDYQTPLEETFLALSDLVRQGKILYVGTSEWTVDQLLRAAALAERYSVPLIVNEPHYSMLWRVAEAMVMPACERLGIGQFASVPLAQGILTGKYRDSVPPGSRAAGPWREAIQGLLTVPGLLDRVELLRGVADDVGMSLAQLAIAWTLQHDNVATAVVGASTPAQVSENVKAVGVKLDLDVLTRVEHLLGSAAQTDPRLIWSPPAGLFSA